MLFGFILSMVASFFLQAVLSKSAEPPKAATFEDFGFPQATEGTPMAVVFGDVWIKDEMILGLTNFRNEAIKAKGGKK